MKTTNPNRQPFAISRQIENILEWPSYSISFLNSPILVDNSSCITSSSPLSSFLIGTNTGDQESNFISLLSPDFSKKQINIVRKYKHMGNVLKLLPIKDNKQSHCVSLSSDHNLYLYDLNQKNTEVATKPFLILSHHTSKLTSGSIGLNKNLVLSSDQNGEIALWDINITKNCGVISPFQTTKLHSGRVNDVTWNMCNEFLYASCGDDKRIFFYDTRDKNKSVNILNSSPEVKISFNHWNKNWFWSGNTDHMIELWDWRNTKIKLFTFIYHKDLITGLKWNPNSEELFTSSSADKTMVIWNWKYWNDCNTF